MSGSAIEPQLIVPLGPGVWAHHSRELALVWAYDDANNVSWYVYFSREEQCRAQG